MAQPHSDSDDMIVELVKDHDEVKELFTKIEASGQDEQREQLIGEVITELVKHSVAEEQHLYPLAREVLDDGDALVDEELQEHAEAEEAMKQLEQLPSDDLQYEPTLSKLIADVRHHIEEEETHLFPRLRETCTPEQLDEAGDKIRRAKSMAPTHPHPSAPDTPPANRVAGPLAGLVDRVRDSLTK
jgi:hemerythrin superfamily protein